MFLILKIIVNILFSFLVAAWLHFFAIPNIQLFFIMVKCKIIIAATILFYKIKTLRLKILIVYYNTKNYLLHLF